MTWVANWDPGLSPGGLCRLCLNRLGDVAVQLGDAMERRGDPLDLELAVRDLPGRLAALLGPCELALVAGGHAGEDRRGASLRLRVVVALTLEISPNIRFAERFARFELAAALAGRGLWGAC